MSTAAIRYFGNPLQKQHKVTAGGFNNKPGPVLSCYWPQYSHLLIIGDGSGIWSVKLINVIDIFIYFKNFWNSKMII